MHALFRRKITYLKLEQANFETMYAEKYSPIAFNMF